MPQDKEFGEEARMTCEEFATAGLDLTVGGQDSPLQRDAREHLRNCPHCAALQENWQALRDELHELGAGSCLAETPPRVELRLRQEFRTIHKTMRTRHIAIVASWSLAAAAVLLVAVAWLNWHQNRAGVIARFVGNTGQPVTQRPNTSQPPRIIAPGGPELGEVLLAANGTEDFTLLPDSIPPSLEDSTVVRVQMQRGALGALGLTVNEERAADWIQVDLLVGDDGLPQAVRLPQTAN